jgi:K+-sensing histidine kinase KdpD
MLAKEDSRALGLERRQEYARLINEFGRHLLSVVNNILDMSRIDTGHFEIVPELFAPERVISDSCQMLALEAREAGIEIVLRLPATSRLGEGTRVTFHLPVNRHSARGGAAPPIERLVPRGFEQSATMRTKKSA